MYSQQHTIDNDNKQQSNIEYKYRSVLLLLDLYSYTATWNLKYLTIVCDFNKIIVNTKHIRKMT